MSDTITARFSVCQFFDDDQYEYVRRNVPAEEALEAFKSYCTSVGARLGLTKRVIITDTGDCTNMEWKHDDGIVFPENLRGQWKKGGQ